MLGQYAWCNLRVELDELEDGVFVDMWAGGRKVHEGLEARVRLTQDTVTVTRNDTATLERAPQVILDVLLGWVRRHSVLHLQDPAQHLLGGETVQRASETLETGGVGQEGVGQRRADQMRRVRGHVAALVVTVQGQVQAQQVLELDVLLAALA